MGLGGDLDEHAREFAREHEILPVRGEVGMVGSPAARDLELVHELEGPRVHEPDAVVLLDHHDRLLAVRGEVEVVRARNGGAALHASLARVDPDQLVGGAGVDVELAQVIGGGDVLRQLARLQHPDDLARLLGDDGDDGPPGVGHVEQGGVPGRGRSDHARLGRCVDVVSHRRRHSGQRFPKRRGHLGGGRS